MALALFNLIFAIILLVLLISTLYYAFRYVPYVPTKYSVVKKMIEAAQIKKGDIIIDLGCGDGRIPIEAAKQGAKATGYEICWLVYLWAKFQKHIQKSKAIIERKNFMKENLSSADTIFCYLWPSVMNKLEIKFKKELKKGAKVISFSFPIKNWKPVGKIQTESENKNHFLIYVYEMGKSNKKS